MRQWWAEQVSECVILSVTPALLLTGCCAQSIFPPGPVVGVVGGSVWFHTTINPSTTEIVTIIWRFGTSSTSPLVVSWNSKTENPGPGYTGRVSVNVSTGALELRGLTAADNGTYSVTIVTAAPDPLTGLVTLNVFGPISSVRVGPKDGQTPELNKTLTLFCEVLGSGTVSSRQWRKESQTLTPSPSISFSSDNSTVTFHLLQQSDAGTYQCTATNPVSSGTGEYRLELQTPRGPSVTNNQDGGLHYADPRFVKDAGSGGAARSGQDNSEYAQIGLNYATHPPPKQEPTLKTRSCLGRRHYPLLDHCLGVTGAPLLGRGLHCSALLLVEGGHIPVSLPRCVPAPIRLFVLQSEVYKSRGPTCQVHTGSASVLLTPHGSPTLCSRHPAAPVSGSESAAVLAQEWAGCGQWAHRLSGVCLTDGPARVVIKGPDTVTAGRDAELVCSADCHPPCSYTWFFNGVQVANGSVVTMRPVTYTDNGVLACEASSSGTGLSVRVFRVITVADPNATVSIQPAHALPIADQPFSLTCNVSGAQVTSRQWVKDDLLLTASSTVTFSADNSTVFFSPLLLLDNAVYQCLADPGTHWISSAKYQLRVIYGPQWLTVAGPHLLAAGGNYTFACSADCFPPCLYAWELGGSPIGQGRTLTLRQVTHRDRGLLTCRASNTASGLTARASEAIAVMEPQQFHKLSKQRQPHQGEFWGPGRGGGACCVYKSTAAGLSSSASPSDMDTARLDALLLLLAALTPGLLAVDVVPSANPVYVGDNVTLELRPPTAISTGTWLFDGSTVVMLFQHQQEAFPGYEGKASVDLSSGALFLESVRLNDSGIYRFQGLVPRILGEVNLTVLGAGLRRVLSRTCVTLPLHCLPPCLNTCRAINSHLQHSKPYRTLYCEPYRTLANSALLERSFLDQSAGLGSLIAGLLWSKVTGDVRDSATMEGRRAGALLFIAATFAKETQSQTPTPQRWVRHYLDRTVLMSASLMYPEPITVVAVRPAGQLPIQDQAFNLSCEVTGPVVSRSWLKDGQPLPPSDRTSFSQDNSTLSFSAALLSDDGLYQCAASNPVSNRTSPGYQLLVNYGPETPVIAGPQEVQTGRTVTLSCSAASQPPSLYYWSVNGTRAGEGSVLQIGQVSPSNTGLYTCTARNTVTNRTSSAERRLTVTGPPSGSPALAGTVGFTVTALLGISALILMGVL
nr:PREDICTED: carcinoembryonic antigen-related cell adhesion molecule 5 [Lepisosteus oculatus]